MHGLHAISDASRKFTHRSDKSTVSESFQGLSIEFCRQSVNKLTSVFSCACPVIDHEFGHKIVSQSRLRIHEALFDPRTTLTMLWRNSLSVVGQTHVKNWPQFISLYTITKCPLSLDNIEPRMTLKETLYSISAIIFFRASIWKYKFKSGKCRLDRYVEQIHS